LRASIVDRVAHDTVGDAAQAQIDNLCAAGSRVANAFGDAGAAGTGVGAHDLDRHDHRLRGHAVDALAVVGGGGDNASDMGAVAEAVVRRLAGVDAVPAVGHLPGEVGVGGVHAGVHHRHLD